MDKQVSIHLYKSCIYILGHNKIICETMLGINQMSQLWPAAANTFVMLCFELNVCCECFPASINRIMAGHDKLYAGEADGMVISTRGRGSLNDA